MYIGKLWQRLSVYERWMWVCVVLAMLLRLLLILFHWPATNSDEGNMGMVALNVAYHGDHPVFFYGLPYMGPVEGYVAVPFFYLFGPSVTTLRLGLLIFLFGFLVGTFYLVRLLFNEKYALAAVILLGLGSPDLFLLQLRAVGEYPEMLMFGTCIPLCALWLSLTVPRVSEVAVMGYQRRRLLVYLLLGAMMGVAVWIDFLIGPFFVMALLMLWAFCRNEVKSRYGLTGLLGFLIGVFPLIYYNVTAPINRNSLNVLLDIHSSGRTEMAAMHLTWLNQLTGSLLMALPWATGANPRCALNAIPPYGSLTAANAGCVLYQGGWGIGYMVLLVLAVVVALRVVWPYWRKLRAGWYQDEGEQGSNRAEVVRYCGRIAMLVSVALTFVLFADSPNSAVTPDTTYRYLTCLLLALPILCWPLWKSIRFERLTQGWRARSAFIVSAALLLIVLGSFVGGVIGTFEQVPSTEATNADDEVLVQSLLKIGATRIYSDYWGGCNWIIFESQEKIICSVLTDQLQPGFNRYTPYQAVVKADPHPAYVFVSGTPGALYLQQHINQLAAHYRLYHFGRFVVYQTY